MRTFGADLRHVLRVSLRNRFAGFLAGLGVTGVLQSSTSTALVVAALAGRGVVETAPALAVMLGADLGSSLVAQSAFAQSPLARPNSDPGRRHRSPERPGLSSTGSAGSRSASA